MAALRQLGYVNVEEGPGLALYGYEGRERPERAEIVIRRRYLQGSANDIGFQWTASGYVPIVSDYDVRAQRRGRFLADVRTAYNEGVVAQIAKRLNGMTTKRQEGQVVKYAVRFS